MTATTTVANVAFESTEVQQVIGFWDEPSQKLTFVRVISQSDPSVNQINAGFRFDNERTTWLTAHTPLLATSKPFKAAAPSRHAFSTAGLPQSPSSAKRD